MPRETKYVNASEAARRLDPPISGERVRQLCKAKRITGARKLGRDWWIPLPIRIKKGKPPGRPRLPRQDSPDAAH